MLVYLWIFISQQSVVKKQLRYLKSWESEKEGKIDVDNILRPKIRIFFAIISCKALSNFALISLLTLLCLNFVFTATR